MIVDSSKLTKLSWQEVSLIDLTPTRDSKYAKRWAALFRHYLATEVFNQVLVKQMDLVVFDSFTDLIVSQARKKFFSFAEFNSDWLR